MPESEVMNNNVLLGLTENMEIIKHIYFKITDKVFNNVFATQTWTVPVTQPVLS